jgi:hypothetical protein
VCVGEECPTQTNGIDALRSPVLNLHAEVQTVRAPAGSLRHVRSASPRSPTRAIGLNGCPWRLLSTPSGTRLVGR